jgi:uncharacterized membrane protein
MESKNLEKALQGDAWLGHPVHPTLVSLPIGIWMFGVLMDGLATVTRNKCLQEAADDAVTAGLVGAGVSAATGLGEFLRVPRTEYVQKVALTHAVINVSAVTIYSVNAIVRNGRRAAGRPGGFIPKLLSLVGMGLIGYSGWLGGNLVFRHGTSVRVEHDETTHAQKQRPKREEREKARV